MKTGNLATRLMMAAIFLTVLIYFAVNLAAYFMDPYTITVAYGYTGENAVTVSGYVVREEEVLPGGGELVYSSRGEGERVSAGGTVAQIYQSAQALQNANTQRSLEGQLEQLLYARSLATDGLTGVRLDEEITGSLISFRSALAGGSMAAAAEQGDGLRAAALKRSYALSGTGELEGAIASLQEQISSMSAAADPGTTRVTAPRAGIFSGLVDGYETVLTPEGILELTPAGYRTIAPAAAPAGVGKMIYGSGWSFLTMMRSEDLSRVQEGDRVTLRFQKGLDRDMEMRVAYISGQEDGRRVVVFTSRPGDLRQLRGRAGAPQRRPGGQPAADRRGRQAAPGRPGQPQDPERHRRILPVGQHGPHQAGEGAVAGGGVHPGGAGRGGAGGLHHGAGPGEPPAAGRGPGDYRGGGAL